MSSSSPRHLLRASTPHLIQANSSSHFNSTGFTPRPAVRLAHTVFPDRSSPSASSAPRRNAHVVASDSKYNNAPPPPPAPGLGTSAKIDGQWETISADDQAGAEGNRRERVEELQAQTINEKPSELVQDMSSPKGKARAVASAPDKLEAPSSVSTSSPSPSPTSLPSSLTVVSQPRLPRRTSAARPQHFLQSSQRLAADTISPYLPPLSKETYASHGPAQPHELPLLSRSDWRLSSPLRRQIRSTPPPLWSRTETDTKSQGHNRLVGVGPGAARVGRGQHAVEGEERWGWKTKVMGAEKGEWKDADTYRKRLERLLALSRASDEQFYRATLARFGTPREREFKRRTLCRAIGEWLTDASQAEAMREAKEKRGGTAAPKEAFRKSRQRAVASFRAEDSRGLTEEDGWKFSAPNTFVRITRALPEVEVDPTAPQPPPNAATDDKWYVQGSVLEARDNQLIVAFEKSDMWPIKEGDIYQIDVGLDESSYVLQQQAIDNLYFDPARQRARNAEHVDAAQQAYLDGTTSLLREWALQGTDLRELIVPKANGPKQSRPAVLQDDEFLADEDDSSPAAELAHLPPPESFLLPDLAASTAESLHPSELFAQNQLINSWIKRYTRDEPLIMPGDPDLGLNASQTKAVAMAMGEKLSLIQGPPGTGKSQTIVSLIALLKRHFRIPQPILLAAPTHVSTDHLLTLLVRAGVNPLRCGRVGKVSPEIERWTIEKRQEQHPLWRKLEEVKEQSERLRDELLKHRDGMAHVSAAARKEAEVYELQLAEKHRNSWRRHGIIENMLYSSLLATADVFCATAMGAGASKILNWVDFPIVFLDEAAMCTEPVTLIPLMKGAQHVTLIGDHKQLPAVITSAVAKKERLQMSMFERLLASQSVKSVLLDTQYRMRPSISAFPNLSFYHSALQDSPTVSARPPPPQSRFFSAPSDAPSSSTVSPSDPPRSDEAVVPVAFVAHTSPEQSNRKSLLNRAEVDLIIEIVGDLLHRNPTLDARDIGIISPYYAQTRLLTNTFDSGWATSRLRSLLGSARARAAQGVEINTVDGFQGREKKIIILSTVRSNAGGHIGFLTDKRRLNVALTRAKDALFVVGNQETLKMAVRNEWLSEGDSDADVGVWRRFLAWCAERGLVREWKENERGPKV
ncbi:hypothetical protein JCM21900_006498 [Sporobolomyces salmonicolor]